jgi:transposase
LAASSDTPLADDNYLGRRDGEVRHVGSIGGDLVALDKSLRKLVSRGLPLHIVYEAGTWGS